MRSAVLDTNAYIALMRGNERVAQALNESRRVIFPLFVVAELTIGFKNGIKEQENRSVLAEFEAMPKVERYYPGDDTVEFFSDIFLKLKKASKPIPVHDIWIAAIAIETGSVVMTYDKHFLEIPGLQVWIPS